MTTHEREAASLFHTYKRLPLDIDRGEGVYLYGRDGRRYLDMFAGLAVNALGYAHPGILRAIETQSKRYIHLSNYYLQEPQIQLAELLLAYTGFKKAFFCNSGTEALEGALKITRRWGSTRGKSEIISFSNAFHGRTMGALSIMDRPKYRNGFEPFLPNCRIVTFNQPDELRAVVSEKTVAVVLETIQGEGGVRPASCQLIDEIIALKEKFGFLVVADEIQSGVGRTGKFLAFQHFTLKPDIVLLAKPIGGGLPLGAILGNETVADVLEPGMHGTTFGGNPVACAAGIAVLHEIRENNLMENAERLGLLLRGGLEKLGKQFPSIVREVRGYGLMVGMELYREAEPFVAAMREKGILINGTDQTVLRFLPPLIVAKEHVEETLTTLQDVVRQVL
jgi:acetylornithine/N-succinyldiaminopimelate aminotransferase